MRAIVYTETGGPETLRLVDKPLVEPGPGEVLVRVHRSGVNPTDWKARSTGDAPGVPHVPNQDGAGVVEAVGEGVEEGLAGLRVWMWESAFQRPEGTAQEYALARRTRVVPLPDSASFDVGAALGVPFVTAHRCLTVGEAGPTRLGPGSLAGRHVLVAGGAGAVGNAAIQLARWSDATVIATVSSAAKAQLAAAAGADHVIDYTTQDVAAEVRKIVPDGVQIVVEVALHQNAALDAQVLAQGGTVAFYGATPDDEATVPVRALMALNSRWQGVLIYSEPEPAKARALEDISAAVLEGAVRVGEHAGLPLIHFPLDATADAHAAVRDAAVGKVLIDVVP